MVTTHQVCMLVFEFPKTHQWLVDIIGTVFILLFASDSTFWDCYILLARFHTSRIEVQEREVREEMRQKSVCKDIYHCNKYLPRSRMDTDYDSICVPDLCTKICPETKFLRVFGSWCVLHN